MRYLSGSWNVAGASVNLMKCIPHLPLRGNLTQFSGVLVILEMLLVEQHGRKFLADGSLLSLYLLLKQDFGVTLAESRSSRWPAQARHPGQARFEMEGTGQPSPWNSLRALWVLKHLYIPPGRHHPSSA